MQELGRDADPFGDIAAIGEAVVGAEAAGEQRQEAGRAGLGLAVEQSLGQHIEVDQVEQREVEAGEQGVGGVGGERALALEDVVDVRLADSGDASEAAFGEFAVGDFEADGGEQPGLELLETKERRGEHLIPP